MDNRWLDAEQKFYNYHTADIDGTDIFDIHKASNSDAQQILDGSDYWKTERNTYSEIIDMTPTEYFEACAKDCFNKPVENIIASRRNDKAILEHLTEVILKYKKKFPISYIDYAQEGNPEQEGLHRMMVAGDLFGWDTKFPVQIIKYIDLERADKEKAFKHKRQIERYLQRAIDRALRYKYYNIDELKTQLYDEFEQEVRYIDEFENREFALDFDVNDTTVNVCIDNKYDGEFDIDKIQLITKSNEIDTDELEDLDLDDISDWLKDLLD